MDPTARLFTSLPVHLHYRGEPNAWVRMTRPGQRLNSFIEGLVIGPDGHFYLADVPYGRIFRIDSATKHWTPLAQYEGEPHGLALTSSGDLRITDYRLGLLHMNLQSGERRILCDRFRGEPFKGLSDLVIDSDDNIWFTDSGRTSLSDPTGRVFRQSADGTLVCVLNNVPYPNGIAISADGAHVFLSVTRANAVWRILRISPEPTPMAGTYIQMSGGLGPDGLAVGVGGILAVAHAQTGSVWLYDKLGDPLARVRTPEGLWVTSVRFGGVDGRTLYIAEAQTGSIFEYRLP